MVSEAAAGMGAALVPRFPVEEELASGRLVEVFALPLATRSAYYVVRPQSEDARRCQTFEAWLVAEAKGAKLARHVPMPTGFNRARASG